MKNLTPKLENTIYLDKEIVDIVKRIAKQKGVGTSTAVRMLIRERLSELKII